MLGGVHGDVPLHGDDVVAGLAASALNCAGGELVSSDGTGDLLCFTLGEVDAFLPPVPPPEPPLPLPAPQPALDSSVFC